MESVQVDYDAHYEKLISDTFDDAVIRQQLEPLWHIIDVIIDRQARDNTCFYGDAGEVYTSIAEFCVAKNVASIPCLYQELFDARRSFISQLKFPLYIQKQWKKRFIEPITARNLSDCPLTKEFKEFLEGDNELYNSVLITLEDFGFPFEWSDEDDV
jgi:hypothetical protein